MSQQPMAQGSGQAKYQTPQVKNKLDEKQCLQANKELMRAIIEKKMKKNGTFFELKVLQREDEDEIEAVALIPK